MITDRELLEQALKLVSKYHARETILVEWEKSVIEAIKARLNEPELKMTDEARELFDSIERRISGEKE